MSESINFEGNGREMTSPKTEAASTGASGGVDELERLRVREREIMELLGTASPDRIMHDLRNVLNEVQLLRALAERM